MKTYFLFILILLTLVSLKPSFASFEQGNPVGHRTQAVNNGINDLWNLLLPDAKILIKTEFNKQAKNLIKNQKADAKFKILSVSNLKYRIDGAPGFTQVAPDSGSVRLPYKGSWYFAFHTKIKFAKGALFKGSREFTKTIKLKVRRARFKAKLNFTEIGPGNLSLEKPKNIKLKFHLSLATDGILSTILVKALSPFINLKINGLVKDAIKGAMDKFYPQLNAKTHGKGAPSLVKDTGVSNEELKEIVIGVEEKLIKYHLPYGTLLRAEMDKANYNSFREDYKKGGLGIDGQVQRWSGEGDSAIWTGFYLASQSYRYAVTKDENVIKNIKHVISGMERMLSVNGNTGLLARDVFPLDTPMGKRFLKSGTVFRKKMIDGRMWGSYQGGGGVSRDQNIGFLFGLNNAYDLLKDRPELQARCAAMTKLMVDYYIREKWILSEDRPKITDPDDPAFPSQWVGPNSKILTILLQALKMFPNDSRYLAQLEKYKGAEDSDWLSEWITMSDQLNGYYKFNLGFIGYQIYFSSEYDPIRRQIVKKAYDILKHNSEHHLNPFFNLAMAKIEKSNDLNDVIEYSIKEFTKRAHRVGGPKEVDLSDVSWEGPFPGKPGERGMKLPTYPLDITHRSYSGFFLWQRSPFEHFIPSHISANRREKPGIDLTLPYWMARYSNLFKN